MKVKQILIIQESAKGGGAEKVLTDLLQHFDRSRYNVTLLLINAYGPHLSEIPAGIKLLCINKQAPGLFVRCLNRFIFLRDALFRHRIKQAVKNKRYDAIISFMEGPAAKAHSFIMDHAVKNISWVHTNLMTNHWSAFIYRNLDEEKAVYNRMDNIVFVSYGAKDAFAKLFGITETLKVIYNIIDYQMINEKAAESVPQKTKFTICNVGRLIEQKRQDRLVEIAKILKDRGFEFAVLILGEGRLASKLKELANDLGVNDVVKFLGYQANPYPYIKNSDVFVLTSDVEGYPTVVCEALCLGRPVISTNITGSDELLANGVGILTGFESQDIADSVSLLIQSKDSWAHYAHLSALRGQQFQPHDIMAQIYSLL